MCASLMAAGVSVFVASIISLNVMLALRFETAHYLVPGFLVWALWSFMSRRFSEEAAIIAALVALIAALIGEPDTPTTVPKRPRSVPMMDMHRTRMDETLFSH